MTVSRFSGDVCYVNEQGEFICGSSSNVEPLDAGTKSAMKAALSARSIPSERVKLILDLAAQVVASPLNDDCVGWRGGDTVQSVHQILAAPAPVMLLFRYHQLPGNVMAAYYTATANYVEAVAAAQHWRSVKQSCPLM